MYDKYIDISGAIGLTILSRQFKSKKKYVYIFADNHNENKYCTTKFEKEYNISNLLDDMKHTSHVLLEEVKRDKSVKLKELWLTSHTVALKTLYLNNSNHITPIDIRHNLYVVSWEVIDSSDSSLFKYLTLQEYLKKFDMFFNFHDIIPSLKTNLMNIKIKNTGIYKYFKKLKKIYNEIKNSINLKQTVIYYKNNNIDILIAIDDLASNIMDWYTIICIFTTNKITFLHAGLFHTDNIINILINDFNFEKIYQVGTVDINNIKSDSIACIKVPIR